VLDAGASLGDREPRTWGDVEQLRRHEDILDVPGGRAENPFAMPRAVAGGCVEMSNAESQGLAHDFVRSVVRSIAPARVRELGSAQAHFG
jgi:hypothetical protein